MHRWESTLKFERKILKLLQSAGAFLADIKEREWAKNPKQTIYPANWLRKKFPHVNYLVTAVEADIVEILVNFIQQTEFANNDSLTYLDCVEDVILDLENLHNKVRKHSKKLLNELLRRELQKWLGKTDYPDDQSQFYEKELVMLYQESVSLYHNIWGSYFENSTRLDMYTIFSMKKFFKKVKSLNEATLVILKG